MPRFTYSEIMNGISVYDEAGNDLGKSHKAAYKSIGQVCASRNAIAAPGMRKSHCLRSVWRTGLIYGLNIASDCVWKMMYLTFTNFLMFFTFNSLS